MPGVSTTLTKGARVQNRRAALEMLAAAFAFATMSCIAHGFGGLVAWPVLAFTRIVVSMVLIHAVRHMAGAPFVVRGTGALWGRSLFGSVGLMCTFFAITRLPVTDAVTIFATTPVWVTVILMAVFRHTMPAGVWLHVLLALSGVYLMHRPTFDAESLPLLVALTGAVAGASAKVALARCHGLHPLSVVAHYTTVATGITMVLCVVAPAAIVLSPDMQPVWWLWLLPMGIAGTLAQVLMTHAYGRGRTTMVAVVGISQIAFAALYDLLVWGYRLDLYKVVGIAMIAVAIMLSVTAAAKHQFGGKSC